MHGQGRPSATRCFTPAFIASVALAIGMIALIDRAWAEDPVDAATSIDRAAVEADGLYDQATQPFEFRSTNSEWPLVPTGDSVELSVRIRSMPQFADRDLVLTYELIRVDDGAVVGREQTDLRLNVEGDSDAISVASSAPTEPGVYEIRCILTEKPDRIWSRLTRSQDRLAAIRTPWLVYSDPQEPDSNTASQVLSKWIDIGSVDRIDPSDWETPSWIPDGATRLVPNVRRVGDSLSPWRNDSSNQVHQLKPGESFAGMVSDLEPHRLYELSVEVSETNFATNPAAVRIDFAPSPAFNQITKSVRFQNTRQLDVSTGQLSIDESHRVLHYANSETEFIRITNDSGDNPLSIDSVRLSKSVADDSNPGDDSLDRRVSVWTRSTSWPVELTSDYASATQSRGYAESTWQMFRLWKALTRLSDHAQWCGYDEINLPIDLNALAQPTSQDQRDAQQSLGSKWAVNVSSLAVARWSEAGGLRVIHRPFGQAPPIDSLVVCFGGNRRSFEGRTASNVADLLTREESRRLTIFDSEFPNSISQSFQESVVQFRKTPPDAKPVESTSGKESGYVHVWVTNAPSDDAARATIVTVINTAPWTSQVNLRFSGGQITQCTLDESENTRAALSVGANQQDRMLTVPPASIANVKVHGLGEAIRLTSWRGSMAGGDQTLSRLKGYISDVVGKIGTLAFPDDYGKLRNGGFEVAGQVGVVGWMHTQFPASAVALDSGEAIEGRHSIRMTTDPTLAGRTWLVSEPIPVPESGRLAVSLSTRAIDNVSESNTTPSLVQRSADRESQRSNSAHRVRVSLEGNRLGKPVRIATEFEVPSDGQWQNRRIVLESDQLRPNEINSVRLTIDSISPGKLWIDDVHLHDQFATHAERTALQGKAFLAIQGLQQRNLKPAAVLLNHDWSRYLLAQTGQERISPGELPLRNTPGTADVRITSSAGSSSFGDKPNGSETNPASGKAVSGNSVPGSPGGSSGGDGRRESVAERIRDWLPKPIRF